MDSDTAESLLRAVRLLTGNAGWEWFTAVCRTRQAAISEALLTPQPEESTARLREEYRTLKEILHFPDQHQQAAMDMLREVREDAGD